MLRTLCEDSLSQFIESPNAPLRSMLFFVIPLLCLPDGGEMDFLGIHATALDSLTSINSLGGIERRTLSQHYKRKGLVTVLPVYPERAVQ